MHPRYLDGKLDYNDPPGKYPASIAEIWLFKNGFFIRAL
jgi:hypothetical protein